MMGMTVNDARQALFSWYDKNDSFVIERDYTKLLLINEEGNEEKKACISAALGDFEKAGLVTSSTYGENEYHILIKPFSTIEQTLSLNAQTATMVSQEVNEFCRLIEDDRDVCDPTDVKEKDIYNLINIIGFYRGDYSEKKSS